MRFRDGSLEPEPARPRDWDISGDGRRYVFHLRQGVRSHDGFPFDAHAVEFNFERMLNADHPFHHTGPFPLAFFFDKLEHIDVVDRYRFALELSEPLAPLFANLAYPTGLMVSPAAVRRHDVGYGRRPAGTGPFRFFDWEPRRRVTLERHSDYWGEPARPQRLFFRPLADPMTRVAELMSGGNDLVTELSPDNVSLHDRERIHPGPHQEPPVDARLLRGSPAPPVLSKRVRAIGGYDIELAHRLATDLGADLELIPVERQKFVFFLSDKQVSADALVTLAMIGSAHTLLYPSYSVVVPKPVAKVPVALALPQHDQVFKAYIDNWLMLQEQSGRLDELYDYWVLGQSIKAGEERWSVIKDVLGWVE